MENDQTNLYVPSATPNEPNKVKLFWRNLNRRQKNVFIVGSVVIVILLVIGFMASMNMIQNNSNNGTSETTDTEDGIAGGENGENDGANPEDYIDPTSTPIEGGDVNNIDTYLPHDARIEISPEFSEEGIFDVKYSIKIDKDNKIITIYVYDMNDTEARAEAEAYLAAIPAGVLDGYKINTEKFYDEEPVEEEEEDSEIYRY